MSHQDLPLVESLKQTADYAKAKFALRADLPQIILLIRNTLEFAAERGEDHCNLNFERSISRQFPSGAIYLQIFLHFLKTHNTFAGIDFEIKNGDIHASFKI